MNSTFYVVFGKRLLDAIICSAALFVLSPLLLLVGMAVKLTSDGPALFSQTRIGHFERPFRILKFRTMQVTKGDSGSLITAAGDPRVTPLGRWLRVTKIDELPQLFNVLVGQMSLVGPRPEVPKYTATYSDQQKHFFLVRPGITSPGINFDEERLLADAADKESLYVSTILPAKLAADLVYCERISFLEDQRIIFETVARVVRRIVRVTIERRGIGAPRNLAT